MWVRIAPLLNVRSSVLIVCFVSLFPTHGLLIHICVVPFLLVLNSSDNTILVTPFLT